MHDKFDDIDLKFKDVVFILVLILSILGLVYYLTLDNEADIVSNDQQPVSKTNDDSET